MKTEAEIRKVMRDLEACNRCIDCRCPKCVESIHDNDVAKKILEWVLGCDSEADRGVEELAALAARVGGVGR